MKGTRRQKKAKIKPLAASSAQPGRKQGIITVQKEDMKRRGINSLKWRYENKRINSSKRRYENRPWYFKGVKV